MKILNLYAGIGGNRKLWSDCEVTAVESEEYIAEAYRKLFPKDKVVVADAHQYLLDHHKEFDFIWSSPPCPTHSKANLSLQGYGIYRYPDMRLYQEIIFLRQFFKGQWVVENVIPYYKPLIPPSFTLDRHNFWTNFDIPKKEEKRYHNVARAKKEILADYHGIEIPEGTKNQRQLLRNAVNPVLGNHILESAILSKVL
jgi:DNA (cytosine-5)-methyltransferase 1